MINIRIDDREFKKFMRTFPKRSTNAIKQELLEIAIDYRNDVIGAMRNTTRMVSRSYRRGGKLHHPSMPGHPPAIDTGNLVKGIGVNRRNDGAAVVSRGAKYVTYLESGTSKMAPRPVWNPELEKIDILGKVIRNIKMRVL